MHPQRHNELYHIIERVIERVIPLWNESLTPQKTPSYSFNRVKYHYAIPEEEESEPEIEEDEDDDDFNERFMDWEEEYNNRVAAQPDIEAFSPPDPELFEEDGITLKSEYRVDLKRDYVDRGIQVVVKLANIHLTPDKPEYEGGTWHVEGQLVSFKLLLTPTALIYGRTNTSAPPPYTITLTRTLPRRTCLSDNLFVLTADSPTTTKDTAGGLKMFLVATEKVLLCKTSGASKHDKAG